MLELLAIPPVTEVQEERQVYLNQTDTMSYMGFRTSDERTSIQFLVQANRFKDLSEGNFKDFVKANYIVQALRNYEAYVKYSK